MVAKWQLWSVTERKIKNFKMKVQLIYGGYFYSNKRVNNFKVICCSNNQEIKTFYANLRKKVVFIPLKIDADSETSFDVIFTLKIYLQQSELGKKCLCSCQTRQLTRCCYLFLVFTRMELESVEQTKHEAHDRTSLGMFSNYKQLSDHTQTAYYRPMLSY